MTTLYDAFDNSLKLNISLALKFGVLLNGASSAHLAKLLPNLEQHLKDTLKDLTGIEEVDGHFTEDAKENDDEDEAAPLGRLHGSFEILAHIGDTFVRRFASASDEVYSLQFKAINQAGIFAKLNAEKNLTEQTFEQVLAYLSTIPVKYSDAEGTTVDSELSQVIKEGFEFINNFYLEFEEKVVAQPAVLNLLMLNYDNFLEANDETKIEKLTYQIVKNIINKDWFKNILPESIRLLAVELALI